MPTSKVINQAHILTTETLNILKTVTSTVAPILTFVLALLGAFTEKKKDKEFTNGDVTYTKKVLTTYGKTIIVLLIISALLTLSGLYVDSFIKKRDTEIQSNLDSINNAKRDSILNIGRLTLDSISSALKATKEIQSTEQEMINNLANQTERIKKLSVPLFPMKIIYSFSRKDNLSDGIFGADNGINPEEIIQLMNSDLGDKSDQHGNQKYLGGELLFYAHAPYNRKPPLPFYIHVYKTSYNDNRAGNTNLQKLSKLVYDKFAPLEMEFNFYTASDNYRNYKNIPLKIFVGKQPKLNTDILYSYSLTVFPSDSIRADLEIEVSEPAYVFNTTNSMSWLDFNNGKLRIYCPWGQIRSVEFLTGPQFSYSIPFKISDKERVDHKTEYQKTISIK